MTNLLYLTLDNEADFGLNHGNGNKQGLKVEHLQRNHPAIANDNKQTNQLTN